jgi:hypothetical protein
MWKWIFRYHYTIEEFANKYGKLHYVVKRSTYWDYWDYQGLTNYISQSPRWYSHSSPTEFETIEKAEAALQRAIWGSAFTIKRSKKSVPKCRRKIKIPPWGNT